MRGSKLTFGFLTDVAVEMVWMAERRLGAEVRNLCQSYDAISIRVKVNLNGGGEVKGKPGL